MEIIFENEIKSNIPYFKILGHIEIKISRSSKTVVIRANYADASIKTAEIQIISEYRDLQLITEKASGKCYEYL